MVKVQGLHEQRSDGLCSAIGVGSSEDGLETSLNLVGVLDVGNRHGSTSPLIIYEADFITCCLDSTALLVQLPSSIPTKASSPAVFAVWRRVSGERVSVQAVHDVRNGKLVLSGGTGHRPVLATFRSLVSGHKADGKRW